MRDKIMNADHKEVVSALYRLIDAGQDLPPGVQVLATATLFSMMMDVLGLSKTDILDATHKLRAASEAFDAGRTMRAAAMYIHEEIAGK